MKIFDLDGPLMRFLERLADIMWLNVLTLIFCIPVITAGASITAMHYVCLKMARNEEGYITKDFFKSFKLNFRQSTILWLMILFLYLVLAGDYFIINQGDVEIGMFVKVVVMLVSIIITITTVMVFPLLARFTNSVKKTIKNAFNVAMLQFPKTVLMILLILCPPFLLWLLGIRILPLVLLFGIALPAYLSALLYNKTFKMLEERFLAKEEPVDTENVEEEDVRIFKDELDDSVESSESAQTDLN